MSTGHFEHVTSEGERWDLIAWSYYRDVTRQSLIITANRAVFVDPASGAIGRVPAILPAGLILRIPVVEQRLDETLLPPWKRGAPVPGVAA
ncbi:hypothetical protein VSX64_14505 [Aurantimonas sp. C2-6-R+9]|uniref:hypothetical protein n=1 Tax=unclassified Aurantimonas TaxID=2638230 RepID=UPI002E19C7FE|nr:MULTISPECIES: hypothetical protein [unclassified Aurantimonas]MEC5291967.1 hypothetical protein [Aurantimonas sp. C2-3-R2]MEC5382079.1 hypothetical protein [Aurantimonas sp. C2-6-R+9]MEC5413053.1 hypothetical protein [Aurantimonas sp. C2-4-R8]